MIVTSDIRYFLDTCALMNHCCELDEPIAISSITIQELNNIKENKNKTEQVRFRAREAARWIKDNLERVHVEIFEEGEVSALSYRKVEDTPDNRIIQNAYDYYQVNHDVLFWTDDILCQIMAEKVFEIPCKQAESSLSGKYTGWIDRDLTNEQIAAIYERPTENILGLLTNQYAVVKGANSQDVVKWDGSSYVRVKIPTIKSKFYGTVKPYQGDVYQQMALDSMANNQITMIKGHAGTGKAQPDSTLIPTPNGKRRLDELMVGDIVYDRLGQETTVIGVYPKGILDNYKITFSDGRVSYCNNDHMWSYFAYDGSIRNITVGEMLRHGIKRKCGNHWKYNYAIPVNKAIEKPQVEYDIDPYVIGAFLGDGCCTASALTLASADEDLVAYVSELIGAHSYYEQNAYSWIFRFREPTGKGIACNYRTKDFFKNYDDELLGKADKKRIPQNYMNGSILQRKRLLQGLLDTDGTICKKTGIIRFFSNSIQLIHDVQELCWSLGYCATLFTSHKERENTEYYIQIICPPQEKPSIFHLKRKKEISLMFCDRKKKMHYNDRITIRSIELVGKEKMRCIMVDNSEQLYITQDYVVTHNTYLSLGYLISQLEKHKIEKIIIFCNPVSTKDAAQLGYLPGTADQKLMDSQIGNTLKAKLGGQFGVSKMINDETLMLLPMSNIRGFDTSGYGPVGVYITESQNYTISLMKLALQRIGEESVVIIDGDYTTQVDRPEYAGSNNGMRRMSDVFRGHKLYGQVELKNIYRSEISRIADNM